MWRRLSLFGYIWMGLCINWKYLFLPLTAIYIILSKIFQSREFPQTFAVTLAYTLLKLDCYTCCNIFLAYRCISLTCEQQTHFQSRSDDRKCVCYSPATQSSLLSERERLFLETRLLAIYHQEKLKGYFLPLRNRVSAGWLWRITWGIGTKQKPRSILNE